MSFEMFLKIEGLHPDHIPVESFNFGASFSASSLGGGAGSGKVTFSDLSIVKLMDRTSTALIDACATGKRFRSATFSFHKWGDQVAFASYKLYDVMLNAVRDAGNRHGDSAPTEEVSLDFRKIDYT